MTPIKLILSKLVDVRKVGNGWSAKCPAHDDQHASLSISEGDDGRVLLRCHAECDLEEICKAIGLGLSALFPSAVGKKGRRRIEATYDYHSADSDLLFQVVRYAPKAFRQRRPDGNGGWIWKLGGTPRVPYRLPELRAAGPDDWVFVVEGEKDADRLRSVGLVATCNPGGAGKWNKLSDDSPLHNRRVAIIADKDEAGRKHAEDVAQRLYGRAADLRVLELPGADNLSTLGVQKSCA